MQTLVIQAIWSVRYLGLFTIIHDSLKSKWIAAEYRLKLLFTEIEKNNNFSIYTRSELNKVREETIKKYDLIDRSNHAKI